MYCSGRKSPHSYNKNGGKKIFRRKISRHQTVEKVEVLPALSDVFAENAPHPKGRGLGNIRIDAEFIGIC